MNTYWIKYWWSTLKWTARIGVIILTIIILMSIITTIKSILFPYKEIVDRWNVVEKPVYKTIVKEIPVRVIEEKEKEKIVEKLKLPDWVKEKEILGTAKIPPHDGNTQVAVSLDPQSGRTDILYKQEPRPFVSLKPKLYVGVDYSPLHSMNQGDYRMFGGYEGGRIWKIKPHLRGEIDERGNWRVSGELRYEF